MLFELPAKPAPFIKWVGGKRALAPVISSMAPDRIPRYWEPFLGGGAIFFHMEERITQAHLSDAGPELITAYQVVRDSPGELVELLRDHAANHQDEGYYYRVRALHDLKDPVEATARFLYLNRTCFNGLYRVNQKGQFNVARGSYKNPIICDPDAIMAAAMTLRKAQIKLADFGETGLHEAGPKENRFVYCDPPHHGTYAGYTVHHFAEPDQTKLRDLITQWAGAGAKVMCSNSNTEFIRDTYRDPMFRINEVSAPRNISADGRTRGSVTELLITTYEPVNTE